jgi:DNA-binding MarR family transcriptional regulator
MSVPSAQQLAEFGEIIRQFRRLRRYAKALLPEEVAQAEARLDELLQQNRPSTGTDFDLLYNIGIILSHQEKPMTMSELSQRLDVPLSTATRIVDLLVKNSYAQRLSDPEDRRVVRITLSETGLAMYQVINEFMQKRIDRVLQHFTVDERDMLIRLLTKLLEVMKEETQSF